MMHGTAQWAYARGDGYQAVLLPYKGGPVAMAIVLPDGPLPGFPLETLGGVAGVLRGLLSAEQYQVDLRLPKFRVEAAFRLTDTLSSLGITRAFSDGADFGGIADEPLKISDVVHKAFIDVDEKGTEAAAATAAAVMLAALRRAPAKRVTFTADRPFLYVVTETTSGTPLFLGQFTRP
jgi:serpin B